jgi:hypothetical protein
LESQAVFHSTRAYSMDIFAFRLKLQWTIWRIPLLVTVSIGNPSNDPLLLCSTVLKKINNNSEYADYVTFFRKHRDSNVMPTEI